MISRLGTYIYTQIFGRFKGEDEFGNQYYEHKNTPKRWVIYKGVADASKVPANWYGWLHSTHDKFLERKYSWQKDHTPNQTCTPPAYKYPHSVDNIAPSSYESYKRWAPEE